MYVAGFERGERPIGLWSMWTTSSNWPVPSTSSYSNGCGNSAGLVVLVQPAGEGRVQRLVDERAFSRAADARHQAQHAERKLDGDVLQIVAARAAQLDPALRRGATRRRRCRCRCGRRANCRCGYPSSFRSSCGVP